MSPKTNHLTPAILFTSTTRLVITRQMPRDHIEYLLWYGRKYGERRKLGYELSDIERMPRVAPDFTRGRLN